MNDLVILGGGPAGYLAAERAAGAGLSALLVEKSELGGVCLNEGCIPTKTLLHSAKIYESAKKGAAFGIHAKEIFLNHAEALERKDKVVKTLTNGVKKTLASRGVKIIGGEGKIAGKNKIGGFDVEANGEIYSGKRLLIATGSEAFLPGIPGLKDGLRSGSVLTSREILNLTAVPKTLAVIGGGVIGLEMACYFAVAGAKVSVVEMLGSVGGHIDSEIASILQKNLEAKGIEFILNAKVVSINGGEIEYERGGTHKLEADKILFSIGRKPSVNDAGLENIGVVFDPSGIKTDAHMQANVPNVYAAGDVTGKIMLAHAAYRQAEVAVNNMTDKREKIRYDAIPSVIYTSPEAASVGETEKSAKEKGFDAVTVRLPMIYSGRYAAETDSGDGICKLVADKNTRRILGCHLICPYASEIILSAAIMIDACVTVERAKSLVFPHPTSGEIIREALFHL